jgi:hypothetical protein
VQVQRHHRHLDGLGGGLRVDGAAIVTGTT